MGKSSDPPPAPDPRVTAQAQAEANKEAIETSARLNRINEYTPFGSTVYTQENSPAYQARLDTYQDRLDAYNRSLGQFNQASGNASQIAAQPSFVQKGEWQVPDYRGTQGAQNVMGLRTNVVPPPPAPPKFDPETDIAWARRTTLSPEEQAKYDTQNRLFGLLSGQVEDVASEPFTFDEGAGDRIEQSTYDRLARLLDPTFEDQQREFETQLAITGNPLGSEAYTRAQDRFFQRKNNAYLDIASQALQLGEGVRQNRLNEQIAVRSQPYNELAAIIQGRGALNVPQTTSPAQYQVAPPDVQGAFANQYAGQLNAFNTQQANRQAGLGGLFGLGSAALGGWLSSRSFKEPISEAEDTLSGVRSLKVDRWQYLWEDMAHIGPYAEDFQRIFGVGDGRTIHPVDAFGVAIAAIRELSGKVDELEARLEAKNG